MNNPKRVTRKRRGTTIVEFTIVSMLLCSFVFGIIEFSWISTNQEALAHATAKAARAGAAGVTVKEMRKQVRAGSGLPVPDSYIAVEYNSETDGSGQWDQVKDDTNSGSPPIANDVPRGKPIRVQVRSWPYPMLTGGFFGWLPQARGGKLPMSAGMQTRRE